MTTTQLRYLLALDTHRHFGRAAAQCFVSQPTLSAQVQKLEEELGVLLFDRSRKPLAPTDLGRRVIAQARVALAEFDRIAALVEEAAEVLAGELRLGVIPTLAPYLLPLVAGPFAEHHPAVTVHVRELRTEELLDELAADRLDAGLIATEETRPGLASTPLFEEPFVAYVGRAHPLWAAEAVAPEDLPGEDLWLLAEGHCFREQVLQVCRRASSASGPLRFESGSLETLRMLVDERGGATLLPLLAVRTLSEAERASVRPFTAPAPQRTVRLVQGRTYLRRALIQAFERTVREAAAPVLTQLRDAGKGEEG